MPTAAAGVDRGVTRSGRVFARRNVPYHASLQELLARHARLLRPDPALTTGFFPIGSPRGGTLSQTTVRFRFDAQDVAETLRDVFLDLFRQTESDSSHGFEVVVTFNAVLSNAAGTSFSLFYGHDYRAGNAFGASDRIRYAAPDGRGSFLVRNLQDAARLPVSFNLEELLELHRNAFDDSGVRIVQFVNLVYLIYQFRR